MLSALPPDTLHADPETMLAFLRRMRESHGSMEGYARAAGLGEDVLRQLRTRLLSDEPVEGDGA